MNLTGRPGGPEPAASEPDALGPVPWEDPARPRLPGYFQTLVEVLWRPAHFFARPARGGPGEPFAFGLITGTTGGLWACSGGRCCCSPPAAAWGRPRRCPGWSGPAPWRP